MMIEDMQEKTNKRYVGYRVSPGAQLYVEDLEKDHQRLRDTNYKLLVQLGVKEVEIGRLKEQNKELESDLFDQHFEMDKQIKELKEELADEQTRHCESVLELQDEIKELKLELVDTQQQYLKKLEEVKNLRERVKDVETYVALNIKLTK